MKLKGEFQLNQPVFGNSLAGGLQITMRPPHPTAEDAMFQDESYTEIVPPFTTPPPTPPYVDEGYGVDVLGVSIAAIFDGDFNLRGQRQGVPLKRIDLSGYGASIFSEWSDSYSAPPKISKVQFDTFVGRTAYEVVQAASILYPWAVQVVRTITLERQAAGWVFRRDGGWQAVTTGEFQFPKLPISSIILDSSVHPGAVPGVFNVRRIRENGVISVLGLTYRRVLFDADVKINPNIAVIAGGFRDAAGNTFVPSREIEAGRDTVQQFTISCCLSARRYRCWP